MLRQDTVELTVEQFEDIVLSSCQDVADQHWRRLITANEGYIADCLHGDPI